jgi:hypothetical protein
MLAEWSVECSAEDPVLVVPWHDPNGSAAFVDLRANPYDLDGIPEAEQHPPLMHALRALNAQRSPVFTAKCDAWPLDGEELAQLQMELDVPPPDAPAGFASYIDLVWRERSIFTSFHQQEQMVQRLVRNAAAIDCPLTSLDCVLRPAIVDLDGPREGYAVSLYVKALGADRQSAWANWAVALEAVVALLRGKDLAGSMGNKARAS